MLSTTHASVQVDSAPPSGRRCPEVLCHIMAVDMGCSTVTQLLVKSCSCPLERRCNVAAHTPRNLPLTALPAYGFGQRALVVCQLLQRKLVMLSQCVERASWLWCAYTVRQGVARLSAGVSQHRSCCNNSSCCSNSSSRRSSSSSSRLRHWHSHEARGVRISALVHSSRRLTLRVCGESVVSLQ